MTKEQAKLKIVELFGSEWTRRQCIDFVDGLEVLGLVKFDEEKPVDSPSMVIKKQLEHAVNAPMFKADEIVNALMRAGYKIVKNTW